MLTKDLIQANEALKTLTPEQITAITEMSAADENKVIGEKTREFWDRIDRDIQSILEVEKPDGAKTHVYLKDTLIDFRNKSKDSGDFKTKYDQLKTQYDDLKQKVDSGKGGEAIQAEYDKLKGQFDDLNTKFGNLQTKYKTDIA